ncbi:hypothetical protein D1872_188530 [compost metagenome]
MSSTQPSLRCSSVAEAMELANPFTRTVVPAPANWAILSYTPNPVSRTEIKIRTVPVGLPAVFFCKIKVGHKEDLNCLVIIKY